MKNSTSSAHQIYRTAFAVAVLAALSANNAAASPIDWAAAANGNWNTPGSWSSGVPTAADDVTFNAAGVNGAEIVTVDTAAAALSLNFSNTGATIIQNDLVNARTLAVGNITVNSGAGLATIRNNTTSGSLGLTLSGGPITWSNSSSNNLFVSSAIGGTTSLFSIGGTRAIELRSTSNTFTGDLSIGASTSTLIADGSNTNATDGSLGNANNDISISNNGTFTIGVGASGNMILNAQRNINISGGARLGLGGFSNSYQNVAGNILGSGGLTFSSSGSNYLLNGENSYTGTTLLSGLVRISSHANIGGVNSAIGTNNTTFTTMGLAIMGTEITNMSGHTFTYAGETLQLDIQDINNTFTWDKTVVRPSNSANAPAFTKSGQGTLVATVEQRLENGGGGLGIMMDFRGGLYVLDAQAGASIKTATGTAHAVGGANRLGFNGGDFTVRGKNDGTSFTQNFGAIKMAGGGGTLTADNNGGAGTTTLNFADFTNLNLIANSAGGSLNLRTANLGSGSAVMTTTELNNAGGIIGSGRVVFQGANFARNTTNVSGGAIGGYTTASVLPASGANGSINYVQGAGAGTVTATQNVGTLKVTGGNGDSLTVSSGQVLGISSHGLLYTGGAAASDNYTITGGTLTANDLIIHQYGTGQLTVESVIANAGTAAARAGTTDISVPANAAIVTGLSSTDGLFVGAPVTGTGIAGSTTIRSIDSNSQITLSTAATASGTPTLTFGALTTTLTKAGSGTLVLTGVNTYGGITYINDGVISIGASNNLGANSVSLNGGTLKTTAGFTNSRSIVLGGSGGTFDVADGITSVMSGTLSGASGSLTVANSGSGTGILNLTNNNTFGGGIRISNGVLRMGSTGAINVAGANTLTFGSGTTQTLQLNGFNGAVAGLTSASTNAVVENVSASTASTFSVNNGANNAYAGVIRNGGTASLSLVKGGRGTLTLTGSNTYTGTTTIGGGIILINAPHTNAGAYSILSGGTLGGTSSISTSSNAGITLGSGAKLSPGASAGTLSASLGTGLLDISAAVGGANTGALVFELGTAGGNSDKFTLAATGPGGLSIGTASLEFADFSFSTLAGFDAGTYTLFGTDTLITGTLGATLTGSIGLYSGMLSFADSNTDLILTVAAVPEPSAFAMLAGGLAVMSFLRRRRTA